MIFLAYGLSLILFVPAFGIDIACDLHKCPPMRVSSKQNGDGNCDTSCMTANCGFDSGGFYKTPYDYQKSDCYSYCNSLRACWNITGNPYACGLYCDSPNCGFMFGGCNYCAPECWKGVRNCDLNCNATSCYWNPWSCPACAALDCNAIMWGDGICNKECENPECRFDNNDCLNSTCAPGCYTWMVNNGICDETCHVEECNYDGSDCDCSPGCFNELLLNEVCDDACNNKACDFDNWKCGYCESGCFLEMLRNDVCDEACNTFNCKYDYFACGCSPSCHPDDYGKCKPECLIRDCLYDQISVDPNKRCNNKNLVLYTVYQQLYNNTLDVPVYFDNCALASNYKCTLDMAMNSSACYSDCYFKECNYGLCNYRCNNPQPAIFSQLCDHCPSLTDCKLTVSFGKIYKYLNLFGMQLAYFDNFKAANVNFILYYVSSIQKGSKPSGDGRFSNPLETLEYALNKTAQDSFADNFVFFLINDGNYTWSRNYTTNFSSGARDVTITSFGKSKVIIKINGWSQFYIQVIAASIKIENAILEGGDQYRTCNTTDYCQYCSYNTYNSADGHYYNDRNQSMYYYIPDPSCNNGQSGPILFGLFSNFNLTLKNVDIRNWRYAYSSIIAGLGTGFVNLFNVNFDNIMLTGQETSAIISSQGFHVTYIGGSVTRLNNGFEFGDPIDFRGFLYNIGLSSKISIKNVNFKYNLVYRKPKSSLTTASLIYANQIQNIEIENCTFEYNYAETGLIHLDINVQDYGTARNESLFLNYLRLTHIFIHDTSFESNYAKLGLVYINFLGKLLNVYLRNLTFESNAAENGALVYVSNPQILGDYKNQTTTYIALSNSNTVPVIYLPRWCKMINLTFNSNYAQSMITTINLVNFELKDLTIDSNGSPIEDKNFNNLLIDYFIKNRDIENLYISKPVNHSNSIDCDYMVSLSNSYNLEISALAISNNTCRSSSPSFIIFNSKIDLSSIRCTGNTGDGILSVCIYLSGLYDINIQDSIFEWNLNDNISGYGVIEIENSNSLRVTNCTFKNNYASYSPAIYFAGQDIYIDSSEFESNEAKKGNGGALNFFLTSLNSKGSAIITSNNFKSNSAYIYGGAIFISAKSTASLYLDLIISQSNFSSSYAAYGSALYIDSPVSLSLSSTVISSIFEENSSKTSGTISLYFYTGILSFKSCKFIKNTSTYGAAFYIDITEDSSSLRSKVIIELSTLRNNTGNSIIDMDNQSRNSTLETKNCMFEMNNGSVASLNFDYFHDSGSIFQYNSAPTGACFYLQNSAILDTNSQFLNNTSEKNGGVIVLDSKSILYCNNCTFIQNKAANGKGGVLDSEQGSTFFIANSKFLKNSCGKDGSVIFEFNCNSATSSIASTEFTENYAEGSGLITLISSEILIESSSISRNSAKGYAPGIKLSFSTAEISNLLFENQESTSGIFIYLFSQSNINIKNSTFNKGNSLEYGGAIYSSSSTITINSSLFSELSSPKGGAMYAIFLSTISIYNSIFLNSNSTIEGGVISADQTTLLIEDSTFSEFSSSGIYGSKLKKLEIKNSSFNNGAGIYGGAVYCQACSSVSISSSNFSNNIASFYGGALYFTTNSEIADSYSIIQSGFYNNIAQNGGAIWINNLGINIDSSAFGKNSAISNKNLENSKIEYGIGGGIRMSCPDIKTCKFIIQKTNFNNNVATYNGGAVSWDYKLPQFINNYYKDNSAVYGQDIASYPTKLMQAKEDGSLIDYKRRVLPLSDSNITDVGSGQKIKTPLLIALVDGMNKIIRTDNLSQASLRAVNSSTQLSGTTQVTAVNGIFNFSDFVISQEPGTDIQIVAESSSIDTDKIEKSGETVYSQSLTFATSMRECELGEVKSGKNCEVCPEGFYSLDPSLISCIACPSWAECFGNYTMAPLPGYWRDNMYTDKFWKCPKRSACIGSPDKHNISFTGECSTAYKGNKCQSCKLGYSRTSDNTCKACPKDELSILGITGITVLLIVVLFIVVWSTRKSAFKQKSRGSIYIKIFFNYLQTVILASYLDLNWSEDVLGLFEVQKSSDYVYQQIYSFQCILQNYQSSSLTYFTSLFVSALIPFLVLLLSFLFWSIFKLIKSNYKTFWDDFISTCIILLFLLHPTIVKKMFSSMNCTEINSGEYWLEEDLDIRCWDYDHIFYMMTVSLPTIALWGLVLPTICLINLTKNRNKLDTLDLRLRYGFLFNGYKVDNFYWEFIILYSKIIIICCSVFLSKISTKVQALIVAILYTIYLRLQQLNNPYNDEKLNHMELRAKLVCVVTIYSGLYYLMGRLNDRASAFFFALIVIANLYFLIYWAFYMLKVIYDWFISKLNKSRFSKTSVVNEFNENSSSIISQSQLSNKVDQSIGSSENMISENQVFISSGVHNYPPMEDNNEVRA